MYDGTDHVYTLRGADDRLTLHVRPQRCVDLVLDGREVIGYVTGVGRNVTETLSDVGIAWRDLGGDPVGPLTPPAPPTTIEALAELVDAVEATRLLDPPSTRGPVTGQLRSDVEMPGRIDPPARTRGVVTDIAGDVTAVAGALTALSVAYEKARAVLGRRPSTSPPPGTPTRQAV